MSDIFGLTLLPASFRGVPFEVTAQNFATGRRVAMHEYPFRDIPYAEDVGKRTRRIPVSGFLLGDDVAGRLQALLGACEEPGPGLLQHPTLGAFQVVCTGIETSERWDQRRAVELRLEFVEAGELEYPSAGDDTQASTRGAGLNAYASAEDDYKTTNAKIVAAGGT